MTIGVNNRNDNTGNGAVDTYSFTFKIFAATDLRVTVRDTAGVETTLTYPTHYTVSGVGAAAGGSVALVNGAFDWLDADGDLETGYALTIRRVRPLTQSTDIRNQTEVFNDVLEDTYDHLMMVDQQQQDEIDRSLKFPETDGVALTTTLPAAGQRALKALIFDADGNVTVSTDDYEDQVATVAASAAAAADSEAAAEAAAVIALAAGEVGSSGFNYRGAWVTATAYAVGDVVDKDGVYYLTLTAHTSGTFATDLAAARWRFFFASKVVYLEQFGAKADGTTDDSAAMEDALTYLDSVGGGVIQFRAKTYRLDSAVIPVVDASATPRQKPILFKGAGCHWSGQGSVLNGSTVLDLRSTGTGGKVQLRGLGFFGSEGITYTNLGTADTNPFIYGTNTTLHLRGNAFIGHTSKIGTACDQDAIVLGGLTQTHDGTEDAPFQGYGTIIEGNYFQHIRRWVYGRVYCNGTKVINNTGWTRCGSNLAGGAAIEFDGDPSGLLPPGNLVVGNVIAGNLVEMNNYPYGVKLSNASQNTVIYNEGYDGTATSLNMVRLESTASGTLVMGSVGPAGKDYLSEATALGQATKHFSGGDDYSQMKNLEIPAGGTVNIRGNFWLRPTTGGIVGVAPTGTLSAAAIWQLLSGTTDSNPDAGGVRFRFNADGSMVNGGNNAGNVTNNLATGAQRYNAGRGWGFGASGRTSGGAMEIDTGSGGSALNIKTFSIPLYDHTNTLRATLKPTANGVESDSDLVLNTAGKGLKIKEGSNARSGTATLSAGTVTVANTSVTANTRIQLTIQSLGTVAAPKAIGVTARVNGTSFTITSADATDTSVVAWQLVEGY